VIATSVAEPPMTDSLSTLLTAAVALLGIVGLILLIGRVLRHTSFVRPKSAGSQLVLSDTIALDARRRLHLVRHGERSVLLLTGGETDLVVGWLDAPKP
jgi:flagellar protein FliO/FliZ